MTKIANGTHGRFTVRSVKLKNGSTGYAVGFAYDAAEVARIRRMPGARWLAGDKVWFVPAEGADILAAHLEIDARSYRAAAPRSVGSVAQADSQGVNRSGGVTTITD